MANTITKIRLGFQTAVLMATVVLAGIVALAKEVPRILSSQTTIRPPATPAWEAVSIKQCRENASDTGQRGGEPGPPFRFSADRMTLRCLTVRTLIQSAYKIYVGDPRGLFSDEDVILLGAFPLTTPIEGGPAWIDSERYMIEAKAEGPVNRKAMQGPLLQAILENRFQLKTHRVSREAPIYALTIAKGGLKLKRFQEGSCSVTPQLDLNGVSEPPAPPKLPPGQKYCEWGGGVNGNEKQTHVEINAKGGTIDQFTRSFLYGEEGKQVINRTGLQGRFDFHLQFAMNEQSRQRYAEITGLSLSELWTSPSIFEALEEQLGLKLESSKGPVEVLVIDSVQKPSEN